MGSWQAQKDVFNALEESPAGNDMDFVAKLHLVEKHIRNNNLKLSFADQLGRASNDANGEITSQVCHLLSASPRLHHNFGPQIAAKHRAEPGDGESGGKPLTQIRYMVL